MNPEFPQKKLIKTLLSSVSTPTYMEQDEKKQNLTRENEWL